MTKSLRPALAFAAVLVPFVTSVALSAANVGAANVSAVEKVDNFRLNDHQGKTHELYYLSDMKAVVLVSQSNVCAAANEGLAKVKALRDQKGVVVLGINSNLGESYEAIAKNVVVGDLPVLSDETQLIGESLGLTKNGEVLVINPTNWELVYRGNADQAGAAVQALLGSQPVTVATAPVTGCAIAMPERAKKALHANISYTKTIAPMLEDKCVACHREGGIGPWAMSSYELVRGFSPMIREVIRTQRMPPWHADPHFQAFSNDRSLTKEQAKTLIHWIEAGAPRGVGVDPLLNQSKTWSEWALGKPDLIVKTPPFNVPATGIVAYQNVTVDSQLDHDVWVRAVDYVPGARAVLHHVIASAGTGRFGGASLNNYVPGAGPLVIPDDNGIFLPKGSKIQFQMHFTTNGKEATDVTQFGLYFMKEPPKYNYRAMIFAQPRLRIPAGAKEHVEKAEQTLRKDSLVFSTHPHSHFRGKSAKFVAYLPDGTERVLLNVPRYDFNWQTTYEMKEPMMLPAGTRIEYTTVFDNSTQNKANPDATREVRWGEQTSEEMVFGVIRYRQLSEDGAANSPQRPGGFNEPSTDFTKIKAE